MKFLYVSIQIQYHLKHLQGKLLKNKVKHCSQQNYKWIDTQMGIAYNCKHDKMFRQTQTVNLGITVINILSMSLMLILQNCPIRMLYLSDMMF